MSRPAYRSRPAGCSWSLTQTKPTASMSDAQTIEARMRYIFEEALAFNRVIGMKVESFDPDAPKLRFDMRPDLIGNPRRQILHGGVICAVLDVAGGFAIHLAMNKNRSAHMQDHHPTVGTIDLRVDFLRPGRGEYFIATARVVRLGKRVGVTHMEMVNDGGDLIATGGAAYMLG